MCLLLLFEGQYKMQELFFSAASNVCSQSHDSHNYILVLNFGLKSVIVVSTGGIWLSTHDVSGCGLVPSAGSSCLSSCWNSAPDQIVHRRGKKFLLM